MNNDVLFFLIPLLLAFSGVLALLRWRDEWSKGPYRRLAGYIVLMCLLLYCFGLSGVAYRSHTLEAEISRFDSDATFITLALLLTTAGTVCTVAGWAFIYFNNRRKSLHHE